MGIVIKVLIIVFGAIICSMIEYFLGVKYQEKVSYTLQIFHKIIYILWGAVILAVILLI